MPALFDDLSRILASRMPRRDALRLFFGTVAGTYLTILWPQSGEAEIQHFCILNPGGCRTSDADNCGGNCCCTHQGDSCCGKFGEGTACCSSDQVKCFNTTDTKCSCCDKRINCCNGDCCAAADCCGEGADQRCCNACEECQNKKCVPKKETPCTNRADGKTKCCPKQGGGVYCCLPGQCC